MDFNNYEEWVQTKLSPKFHSDPNDSTESELRSAIEDFIEAGNRLDVLKKNKFYGRNNESGVNVRKSETEFKKETEDEQILHSALGMATESVEILEALVASKWNGKKFDEVNFLEEMGDMEFYRSIPYKVLGWTEKNVRITNYFKLEKRYPEGYTDEDAVNRDLVEERKILESNHSNNNKNNDQIFLLWQ